MRAGDRVFCDTNVLLSATDRGRALHGRALSVLNELPARGIELCVSGQVLREFLVVSTRPAAANGLGMTLADAVNNVRAVVERTTVLEETRGVAERLRRIIQEVQCMGKEIHDANIAATMLEHGLTVVVTENAKDLRRFADLEVVPLDAVS